MKQENNLSVTLILFYFFKVKEISYKRAFEIKSYCSFRVGAECIFLSNQFKLKVQSKVGATSR
ncbi:hypothetical protein CP883_11385 [Cutibacterium acnes]|nr:hypothetical protein CP883_11385 [Cutibacterium acnes]